MKFLSVFRFLPVIAITITISPSLFSQVLPLDQEVKTGKLANGFTYYIRKNAKPEKRAELYLVNKVGAILEDDDQQGLAHFMEHMNFNGTKHFPKNQLVDYLEKAGVKFGADLNAYTSFDETVYQLPIPTGDKAVFKNGLQIMRDWAQEALLDPAEIDKERGVVLEEKRLGMGAGERLRRKYLPMLFNNSRYANRLPIGTEEILKSFKLAVLKRYLKDWYRPNLQALIVVGDIDVNVVEAQIKKLFGDLKNPAVQKQRTKYTISLNGKNQYQCFTDKELSSTEIQLMVKHKATTLKTAVDYRRAIIIALFNQMMAARFNEVMQQQDLPFVNAGTSINGFIGGLDMFSINIVSKPAQIEKAFKFPLREIEKVKQFGFTPSELQRAKDNYQSGMNAALREKSKTSSRSFVNEYQRHFLTGEAAPGIGYEHKLVTEILKEITLADLATLTKEYIKDINRDILILAPESEKNNLPAESVVNNWIDDVKKERLSAWQDNFSNTPLLQDIPVPGNILDEKQITSLGLTQLTLGNGIKVVLKPTEFKNDEILFRAFSPGGTFLYSDDDFPSASYADGIISSFGIGSFDAKQLPKKLAGKRLRVSPYINERWEGLGGSASPADLETAFQLMHLYFTQPRKDQALFDNIIELSKLQIANQYNDPSNVFSDTMSAVLSNYNTRRTGPSLKKLVQINLEKLYSIYRERFADASDFTFVFTGSFDINIIKPLLETYLGSLPALNRNEKAVDLGIHIPEGNFTKKVYKGTEDKATVKIVYSGNFVYDTTSTIALDALTEVLQMKLTRRLREEESGVYSPSVMVNYNKYPRNRYAVSINFGCAPANVDNLIKATEEEIHKLQENGAGREAVEKLIAEEEKDLEKSIRTNNFWLSWLSSYYQDNEDPTYINRYLAELRKVNTGTIQNAAKEYLNSSNRIEFILLPEALKPIQ